MRVPVVVGIMGGVGAGKDAFSKTVQKYLSDKFKLTTCILHENDPQSMVTDEGSKDGLVSADVIMVNGSSHLHDERHRTPIDFKVFIHSNNDAHVPHYVNNAKGRVSLQHATDFHLTETKPIGTALRAGKHPDFLAQDDINQEEMNVLGSMISDLCIKRGILSVSGQHGTA